MTVCKTGKDPRPASVCVVVGTDSSGTVLMIEDGEALLQRGFVCPTNNSLSVLFRLVLSVGRVHLNS